MNTLVTAARRVDPYFLLGLAALAIAGAVILVRRDRGAPPRFDRIPIAVVAAYDSLELSHRIGRAGMTSLQEISDYRCLGCAEAHASIWPLLEPLVTANKVSYLVLEVPAREYSAHASIFAKCVATLDSAAYWRFRSLLFATQGEWSSAFPVERQLHALAGRVTDSSKVRSCIDSHGSKYRRLIGEVGAAAYAAGVRFTPVWAIDNKVVSVDSVMRLLRSISASQ